MVVGVQIGTIPVLPPLVAYLTDRDCGVCSTKFTFTNHEAPRVFDDIDASLHDTPAEKICDYRV